MDQTMKAFVALSPGKAEYQDVPKYEAEKNMVVIKVKRAGICATDYAIYSGDCSFVREGTIQYPVRFGHEWSGVVEAVGSEVTKFKPGDKVISDSGIACGECEFCRKGDYMACRSRKCVGTIKTWDGAFAEYIHIPEYHLYRVPDNVSLEDAALVEPATIAYDGFANVDMSQVETVAVYGTGAIGMASVWLAKYFGAKTVIVIGRTDSKLEIAKQIGADVVINNGKTDVVEELKALTDGKGVDLSIETSGAEQMISVAIYGTRRYGRISLLSFYEKNVDQLPIDHVVINCLTIRGAAGRYGYPGKVLEIMEKNPMKLTPIITHHLPFAECEDAFKNERKYHKEKIKIMIDME